MARFGAGRAGLVPAASDLPGSGLESVPPAPHSSWPHPRHRDTDSVQTTPRENRTLGMMWCFTMRAHLSVPVVRRCEKYGRPFPYHLLSFYFEGVVALVVAETNGRVSSRPLPSPARPDSALPRHMVLVEAVLIHIQGLSGQFRPGVGRPPGQVLLIPSCGSPAECVPQACPRSWR